MIDEDKFIFKCQIGVTFHEGHEDPYTIYLQDRTPGCEWIHFYIFKTIEAASKALGKELPGIIAKRQRPLGLTDNCLHRGQEKA